MAANPPKITDVTRYWTEAPEDQSARCTFWIKRFAAGWRPNSRIHEMGYHDRAEYYGVYIWELINVLEPALDALAPEARLG